MKPVKKEKHTPKHYLPDTTPKIAAAGATVLVLLVVLSFVLSSGWMHGSSTGIILPGSEGDSPTVGTGRALLTGQSVDDITIDVNNAKTVIATLARPAAYSSRIENTIYYDGGSAALYCHRYVRDNVMRTDTLGSDNQVQSTRGMQGTALLIRAKPAICPMTQLLCCRHTRMFWLTKYS